MDATANWPDETLARGGERLIAAMTAAVRAARLPEPIRV